MGPMVKRPALWRSFAERVVTGEVDADADDGAVAEAEGAATDRCPP